MEELIKIIDIKCDKYGKLKIYKGWFYDFAEMLFQQGYTKEQITDILNQMLKDAYVENMSKKGMVKYFGNVQYAIDNEKAFFEYIKNKLAKKNKEYLEEGLNYAGQQARNVGNFIDAFIKYVVITNFEDLQLQYKDQTNEHWQSMIVSCCLGNFSLSTMLCEVETDKIYFDEVHTRKNLTGIKIGTVLFRKLFKTIHDEFPDKDLYTLRLKRENESARRFYERMGGTIYNYGNESQLGVIYKKEDIEKLSQQSIVPPKLHPNRREVFLDSLRFESTNNEQNPFPSDEDIVKNMNINEKFYSFNMEEIDKKIRIPKLTKNGEQLFLYRKNIKSKQLGAINYKIQSVYYIINKSGKIVGRVPISISVPTSLSMDYWIKDEFQGQGIGSVVLEEIVRQIYNEKAFNGIDFKASKFPETDKTAIQNIQLEISDDNDASIRIATKNGFNKIGERSYSLTLKDFLDMNQERKEI